jgi:hypothetical protein
LLEHSIIKAEKLNYYLRDSVYYFIFPSGEWDKYTKKQSTACCEPKEVLPIHEVSFSMTI